MAEVKRQKKAGLKTRGDRSSRLKSRSIGSYEAKTHLPRLLAEVENEGRRFTITRNGHPIATLQPIGTAIEFSTDELIVQLRAARQGVRLGGLNIAELKRLGRK